MLSAKRWSIATTHCRSRGRPHWRASAEVGVCYVPRAVSEADQRLIKRIDALNLAHPFAGSRMLRDMFNR